jgi:hypothetical protein
MRQRFEVPPIPDRSEGIKLTQQLQQHTLGAGRIGGCGTDSARQPIRLCLLLIGDLLWCRPVMDGYRRTS